VVAAVRRAGTDLGAVTPGVFAERVARLREMSARGDDRAAGADRRAFESVVALLGACRAGDSYARVRPCDVFQASGMEFDTRRTDAALAGSGIACPPPGEALLDRYVAWMLA
jgi:hypothetical protein